MRHRPQPVHEPDYDDPKEPYAFFGLAAYFAQCFDQSLVLLLVAEDFLNHRTPRNRGALDELFSKLDRKTMGQLIKQARKRIRIDKSIEEMLNEVLDKRNYLMHRFFLVNAEKFFQDETRRQMIDELRDLSATFRAGDEVLKMIYMPLWRQLGLSDAALEKECAKMGMPPEVIESLTSD